MAAVNRGKKPKKKKKSPVSSSSSSSSSSSGRVSKRGRGRGGRSGNKTKTTKKIKTYKSVLIKGGGKAKGKGRGKSAGAAAKVKKSKGKRSGRKKLIEAAARIPSGVSTIPPRGPRCPAPRLTAYQGRIYYGSGLWGGGGEGQRQVGGGDGTTFASAAPVRTTCNPNSDIPPGPVLGHRAPATRYSDSSYDYYGGGWGHDNNEDGLYYGSGLGAVFSSIFRTLVPVFKGVFRIGSAVAKSPAGQAIKKEVIKSGLNAGISVVGDALRGRNVLQSAKDRVKQQAEKLPSNVEKAVVKATSSSSSSSGKNNKKKNGRSAVVIKTPMTKRTTRVNKPPNGSLSSSGIARRKVIATTSSELPPRGLKRIVPKKLTKLTKIWKKSNDDDRRRKDIFRRR